MAAIEPTPIERLNAADAAAGLALSNEVGWNQTLADWRYFLSEGLVFGIRSNGRIVATAALLPMPPITWVSLVIVTASQRRQKLAQRLMTHCLSEARARGLQPHLDATPAGATVYGPIGFAETGLSLQRLRRTGAAGTPAPASADDLTRLVAADAQALGVERRSLIHDLAQRPGSYIRANTGAIALVREGGQARHIGPLIARDASAAATLLADIVHTDRAPLLIDVSDAHPAITVMLVEQGFAIERPFGRMRFGAAQIDGDVASIVASAGPEYG